MSNVIIFVGDKPSSKNKSKDIPFVGTKSYKNLLEWIYRMDLDISNVVLTNQDKFEHCYVSGWIYYNGKQIGRSNTAKIVVLGNKAEDKVQETSILDYFKLPHPSPKNRKLNNKDYIKRELNKCKEFLNAK